MKTLAALLVFVPAFSAGDAGEIIHLTPEQVARCRNGGGCMVVPVDEFQAELAKWLRRAYDKGAASCNSVSR